MQPIKHGSSGTAADSSHFTHRPAGSGCRYSSPHCRLITTSGAVTGHQAVTTAGTPPLRATASHSTPLEVAPFLSRPREHGHAGPAMSESALAGSTRRAGYQDGTQSAQWRTITSAATPPHLHPFSLLFFFFFSGGKKKRPAVSVRF